MPQDYGSGNPRMPVSVVLMDAMGDILGINTDGSLPITGTLTPFGTQTVQQLAANVTQIAAFGTATIKAGGGIYWGYYPVALGTLASLSIFDINGTNTKSLAAAAVLASLNSIVTPAPAVGMKFDGNLVAIFSGTLAGTVNVLWD